jgi:cysteine-rich repeat protein
MKGRHGSRIVAAAWAITVVLLSASSGIAGRIDLRNCHMRLNPAKQSFRATCLASLSADIPGLLPSRVAIGLADEDSASCFEQVVQPVRSGRCWVFKGKGEATLRHFRLCENEAQPGTYSLMVRIGGGGAAGVLECIDQDEAIFSFAVGGTTSGQVPLGDGQSALQGTTRIENPVAETRIVLARNERSGLYTMGQLVDRDCANPSCIDTRSCDCNMDAPRACYPNQSPYNCHQPTKQCDPRPRTARRDNPKSMCFPIIGIGPVDLLDSTGRVLGRLTDTRVRLNFGVRRKINGTDMVMAFSAATNAGALTGWIPKDRVGNLFPYFFEAPLPPPPPGQLVPRRIKRDRWSEQDKGLKTDPNYCNTDTGSAWHYLGRSNNTVNLVWNTPGLGSPTIEVYPNDDPNLVFYESKAVGAIEVPLYDCTKSPPEKKRSLKFVYGRVGSDGLWGWMAEPNLAPPACGDGLRQDPEECDDGNAVCGDGCDPNCKRSGCGNGYLCTAAGEQCDQPGLTCSSKTAVCNNQCRCEEWGVCGVRCCDGSFNDALRAPNPEGCRYLVDTVQSLQRDPLDQTFTWNPCWSHGGWTELLFNGQRFASYPCGTCYVQCCDQTWLGGSEGSYVKCTNSLLCGGVRTRDDYCNQRIRCDDSHRGTRNIVWLPDGGVSITWYYYDPDCREWR